MSFSQRKRLENEKKGVNLCILNLPFFLTKIALNQNPPILELNKIQIVQEFALKSTARFHSNSCRRFLEAFKTKQ